MGTICGKGKDMKKILAKFRALDIRATVATLRTLDMRAARRLFAVLERKPIIEISQSGWAGGLAQVHVGFASRRGLTSAMTHADDDAGNARCSSYAHTLSTITGLTVVDRRETAKNEADAFNGFRALPRDAAPEAEIEPTRGTLGGFRLLGGLRIA